MRDTLPLLQEITFPELRRERLVTVQVNLGYRCNQACLHCHVNAGPTRKEMMSQGTIDEVLEFVSASRAVTLDLTGGAPELNPGFRGMVARAVDQGVRVIDRCNLTVLLEPGQEGLADFLAEHSVEICASLPCYLEQNVDEQRGAGVYAKSIEAIRCLNALGYGAADSGLILNLVYNPTGPWLPPAQQKLEQDYKRELFERHRIAFNSLFTIANMPIKRFGSTLVSKGQFDEYMTLLREAHQHANLEHVMCRSLVSIDWEGYVYDCDFNQMLDLGLGENRKGRTHVSDLAGENLEGRQIAVAGHCFGCTAGGGSSCGGALAE